MFALALPPMLLLSWFSSLFLSSFSLFRSLFRFFFSLLFFFNSLDSELYLSDIPPLNYKQTHDATISDPLFSKITYFNHHPPPHFQNASQEDRWCLCGQAQGYSCLVPGLFTLSSDFFETRVRFCDLAKALRADRHFAIAMRQKSFRLANHRDRT